MEILETNFSEKLPEIVEAIDRASFVTFDQEFTGLIRENTFSQPYSSIQSHYSKLQKSFDGYIVIQLGLTAFWVDPEDKTKFQCKSFNIYLWPRGRKGSFRCESSCIEFLINNGFDFNKLFLKGVPCCSLQESEKMKTELLHRQSERAKQLTKTEPNIYSHIPIPDEEKENLNKACEDIDKFLESDEEELVFENFNGFQRKLIYQIIEQKYFGKISANSKELENKRKGIAITRKKSLEEEKKMLEEKFEQEMKDLDAQIGVTHVLKALSESKTLLIGHNMFADLIYLMRQFTGPLPDDLDDFKKLVHDFFPNILDTKYLCTADSLKSNINSTVLSHLLDTCRNEPFEMPQVEFLSEEKYLIDDEREHEAGYDSFITGICLISLAKYLKIAPKDLNARCKKFKSFKNKIFLMGLENINCVNLTGPDEKPSRQHVFHISFPSTWKNADIYRHFKNFGQVCIKWINESSAFVALQQREYSTCLMKNIGFSPGVTVCPYSEFENSQMQSDTPKKRKSPEEKPQEEDGQTTSKKSRTVSKRFEENSNW